MISGITKWDPFWGDPNMMQIYSCCCCLYHSWSIPFHSLFLLAVLLPFLDFLGWWSKCFQRLLVTPLKALLFGHNFWGFWAPGGPEETSMIQNAPNWGIGPNRVGNIELVIEKMNGDLMVDVFFKRPSKKTYHQSPVKTVPPRKKTPFFFSGLLNYEGKPRVTGTMVAK